MRAQWDGLLYFFRFDGGALYLFVTRPTTCANATTCDAALCIAARLWRRSCERIRRIILLVFNAKLGALIAAAARRRRCSRPL